MGNQYKKARKKDRNLKQAEKHARQYKQYKKDIQKEFVVYTAMIKDFSESIDKFNTITNVLFVICRKRDIEACKSLFTIKNNITNVFKYIHDLKNTFSLIKKTQIDPMKCMQLIGEKLIPLVTEAQDKISIIFSMYNENINTYKDILVKAKEDETFMLEPEAEYIDKLLEILDSFVQENEQIQTMKSGLDLTGEIDSADEKLIEVDSDSKESDVIIPEVVNI